MNVVIYAVITFVMFFAVGLAYTDELTGSSTVEGRLFPHSPSYSGQKHHNGSLALTAEIYQEYGTGLSITATPFARFDSSDAERTHFDFRELNLLYLVNNWELKIGISRVFWGATEFVHLVDIINQTDLVEDIDGEDKLGQPMMQLSLVSDWGVVDGFILPFFRERTFPGEKGRLRGAVVVDTDRPLYESGAGMHHLDFAVRYSHTLGNSDFAISQFIGTGREPTLITGTNISADPVLIPYYQQISQTAVDLQIVQGEWLWKGEALYRSGQGRNFAAATFGFEYTMYGMLGSNMDMGFLGEYIYDDRDETVVTPYNNDLMVGLRWTVNDADDTELLAGITKDLKYPSMIFSVEASRRLGESAKIECRGIFFVQADSNDPIVSLMDDDYLQIKTIFYF